MKTTLLIAVFVSSVLGQIIPAPTKPHPRLPGPAKDGYLVEMPPEVRAEHIARVNAWEPGTRTRFADIQAAVIVTQFEPRTAGKLDAWLNSWDLGASPRPIWPAGMNEAHGAILAAWIYDQCYAEISQEMRDRWLAKVVTSLERLRAVWIQNRYTWFNSVAYNRTGAALIWCALAAYPDAAPYTGWDRWDWTVGRYIEGLEIWDSMLAGGAWPEGWTYWGQGGKAIYLSLAAIDASYGSSFLTDLPWVRDSLRMADYLVEPDGTAVPCGDNHTQLINLGPSDWASFEAYVETAYATGDPHAIARIGVRSPWTLPTWPWGHRSPGVLPQPPPPLPLARRFDGAGIVSMRDAWAGEDTAMFWVLAAGNNVSHQPIWPGHFEAWLRGLLAGNSGDYAGGALSEQNRAYRRHFAGNHLRFHDASDESSDYTERMVVGRNGSQDIYANVVLPNGGGPKRVDSGWTSKPITLADLRARAAEYQTARILDHVHGGEWDHVRIDCTQAYRSFPGAAPHIGRTDRVHRYERHFVRLGRVLIVADVIHLTKPDILLEWVMHTRKPAVQERPDLWAVRMDALQEHQYGWDRRLRYATADRRYQYDGRAWVQILRPEGPAQVLTTEVRSDWSHVDGMAYSRQQSSAYANKPTRVAADPTIGPAEACGHRIEVRYPSNGGVFRVLAHVLSVGEFHEAYVDGPSIVIPSLGRSVHFELSGAVEVR